MTVELKPRVILLHVLLVSACVLAHHATASDESPLVRGKNQVAACVAGCEGEFFQCNITCQDGPNSGAACASDQECRGPCTGSGAIRIEWYDSGGALVKWQEWDPVPIHGVRALFYSDEDGDETSLSCLVDGNVENETVTAILEPRGKGCNPEVRPYSNCWRVTALANDG